MLIDAHNHLADPRFDGQREEIISEMKATGILHCVVNGTHPDDWPLVADLAEQHPDFITPSFGLHPWKVKERPSDWLAQLKSYLDRFPNAGLGECGLDRWIKNPRFTEQVEVFESQLQLAESLNRPTTIHCLKAWGPLLKILHRQQSLPPFLVHSFGGSLEIGQELSKLGAYFSISGYFLLDRKQSQLDLFRSLPPTQLLLETDAPDMLPPLEFRSQLPDEINHPANLARFSPVISERLQIPLDHFAERTKNFFKITHFSR